MLVLTIDTSTPSVTAGVVRMRTSHETVAALRGGAGPDEPAARPAVVLAERSVTDPFAHAERLMPLAAEALAAAGHSLRDIDGVVVGLGPGPFTGLRVGIATAAALGDGLDVPVHGVPSHDATARALTAELRRRAPGDLLVVTDARRREVYLSAFRSGTRVVGPVVAAPAAVRGMLADNGVYPAYLAGAAAGLLEPYRVSGFEPAPVGGSRESMSLGLAEQAGISLLTGAVPVALTPLYLRRPDATEPGIRKSVLGR